MKRPDFIIDEDIERWSQVIELEPAHVRRFASFEPGREVLYASLWLAEQLFQEGCPLEIITRIQYTMGSLSFGHDPWEIAQEMLEAFKNNTMEFEIDYNEDARVN